MSDALRAANAQIAAAYDKLQYDPAPNPALDTNRILGISALYGCARSASDVLDIGCGTGSQLLRLGDQVGGKLVGFDISGDACRIAEERMARFGARARIFQADAMDVTAKSLGQFDLIHCVGTLYVTPTAVREKLLELVGKCLRPGGVAVFSYYAGSGPLLRAQLHRTVRAARDPGLDMAGAVQAARQMIKAWGEALPANVAGRDFLVEVMNTTLRLGDVVFFHEVLNQAFEALSTTGLRETLAPHGVEFLTYLNPIGEPIGDAKVRAIRADVLDFSGGGYRYALFGKPLKGSAGFDLLAGGPVWRSGVARSDGPYGPPAVFVTEGGVSLTVGEPLTQAVLDVLAVRPSALAAAQTEAAQRLAAQAIVVGPDAEAALRNDLAYLWRSGLLTPLVG